MVGMKRVAIPVVSFCFPFRSFRFVSFSRMLYINPDHVGKIVEFQDKPLKLSIYVPGDAEKGFILSVAPCTHAGVYVLRWNKERYSTTSEEAKRHLLTALEFARISTYAPTHKIAIEIPFYPALIMDATEIEKALDLFKTAMDNYF